MTAGLRRLALAVAGLLALCISGCAFLEKPAAVDVLVRRELPPLKQRVTTLEGQVADKADRADLEGKANRDDVPTRTEVAVLEDLAEAHTDLLSSIVQTVESQADAIGALQAREHQAVQRVASTEVKLSVEAKRGQERLRSEMVLMPLKMELASATGVNMGQIEHTALVGFTSGKAQLETLLAQDRKAREQLKALRAQLVGGKIEILQIAAFEDTGKCRLPGDGECATVAVRRGLAVAAYLGAPRTLVQASEPTDRWGSPPENRRVVVLYLKKTPRRAASSATPPPNRRKP